MNLSGERIGVFGLGVTGKSVARFLVKHRAEVIGVDEAKDRKKVAEIKKFAKEMGIEAHVGSFESRVLKDCSSVVVSPGVDIKHRKLEYLRSRNIPIVGEIELGYRFCEAPIIAVTGSNGKTTTTSLTAHILSRRKRAFAVGNIGKAFIDIVDEAKREDVVCLEVSSFQLETCVTFSPKVAVITNITSDHLERHLTFDAYAEIKRSIVKNMKRGGKVIYNAEDENLQPELFRKTHVVFIPFSGAGEVAHPGSFYANGKLVINVKGAEIAVPSDYLRLPGIHNIENALAGMSSARLFGATKSDLEEGLKTFKGYEHRLELVREINGVRYFNDSKATNPEASVAALKCFKEKIVLIAGGRDKETSLHTWTREVVRACGAVILIGEATRRFRKELQDAGFQPVHTAMSMEEAVKKASDLVKPGGVVLLSPACASFDMFDNFEERGNVFKQAVMAL